MHLAPTIQQKVFLMVLFIYKHFFLDKVDTPQTTTIGSAFMPWGLHREPPVAHQNARRQLATRLTYHVPEPTTTLFHHFR